MLPTLIKRPLKNAADSFARYHVIYWNHLSRLTGLLIICNISLFFLTGLVIHQRYYYTFFSLTCYGIVEFCLLLPVGGLKRLGYYLSLVVVEAIGTYFLVASIWYWVTTNRL